MAIIDSYNLPAPVLAAIQNDEHVSQGSHIGAASLASPPKQLALRKRHADAITEEAVDRVWSLFGQAVHVVLERAGKDQSPERRRVDDAITLIESLLPTDTSIVDGPLFAAIENLHRLRERYAPAPQTFLTFTEERWEIEVLGWRVAARCDHLTLDGDGTLTDYKVSSVWSVKDGAKSDWVAQLNATDQIRADATGAPRAGRLQAVVFCRDWRKNERLQYGDDYPEQQVVTVRIPVWSPEKTRAYIEQRVALHQAAQLHGELPDCTAEERWERPTTWAVKKPANKKATRVYATRAEAQQHVASAPDLIVEERPGVSPRCAQYCTALPFCAQGQALVPPAPNT